MRSLRNITLSALLTIGAFSAITYTACTKDECDGVVCQNNGTCVGGTCSCPAGYEGTRCETKSNAKFAGTWAASETCGGSASNYQVIITADPANPTQVLVNNLGDYGCTVGGKVTFSGTVHTATLSIQDSKCGYEMDATGTYDNGTITISYTASYDLGSGLVTDHCTASLSK